MARKGLYTETFVHNGKRKYVYGKTPQEAHDKAVKQKALLEARVRSADERYTVEEWSKKWLRDYKDGAVSDAWYKAMEGIVENHIVPEIGDMLMSDVKASDIKRLLNKKTNFSVSHQKKVAQILLQIFDSAEENDVVVKLPIKRIKTAQKPNKSRTRAITDEERALTLRTAEKYPREGLPFLLMLYCGLRPQEVARLKMSDYDSENKVLHIRRARKADGSTGQPKSESGVRDIIVPNKLADVLASLNLKADDYICTSAQGYPLTKTSQKRSWNRFKRLMDIENGAKVFRNSIVESTIAEDLRPYCYRHTYCTDLQDAGVPITVAQRLMGHSDIRMTAEIYTHHSNKSFEDAREKIEKLHNK